MPSSYLVIASASHAGAKLLQVAAVLAPVLNPHGELRCDLVLSVKVLTLLTALTARLQRLSSLCASARSRELLAEGVRLMRLHRLWKDTPAAGGCFTAKRVPWRQTLLGEI